MSRETGLSPASVMRIWHAFRIKPHLEKTFKLSTDPLFVDKVHDIVGLYLNPPDRALVLCIDEKSQIPLLRKHRHYLIHGTVSKTQSPPMPGGCSRSDQGCCSGAKSRCLQRPRSVCCFRSIPSVTLAKKFNRRRAVEFDYSLRGQRFRTLRYR